MFCIALLGSGINSSAANGRMYSLETCSTGSMEGADLSVAPKESEETCSPLLSFYSFLGTCRS